MTPSSFHEFGCDIPKGDRSTYEHECLSRIFESMVCVDQLNPSSLQSAELVIRQTQVIREAHRLSPSAPDYTADHFIVSWKSRTPSHSFAMSWPFSGCWRIPSLADQGTATATLSRGCMSSLDLTSVPMVCHGRKQPVLHDIAACCKTHNNRCRFTSKRWQRF